MVCERGATLSNLASVPKLRKSRETLPILLVCNPMSLNNKMDELTTFILNNSVDIVCVSETWIRPNSFQDYLQVDGFSLF